MSNAFRGAAIAGHTIGASKVLGYLLIAISGGLVLMNGYHMSNYLVAKLTSQTTSPLFTLTLQYIGFVIAAIEIPLGMAFITHYRLHGVTTGVLVQGILGITIAALAMAAGIGSQLADADERQSQVDAHWTALGSYASDQRAAALKRDALVARAGVIRDVNSREIAELDAQQQYHETIATLDRMRAQHQSTKPIEILENGSPMHLFLIALFSFVCSVGAFFCSCFSAVFINPLVALPAFSLKAKPEHDWRSDGSDFQVVKHNISPIGLRLNGFLMRETLPARIHQPPAPTIDKPDSNKHSIGDEKNRPQPVNKETGAVLKDPQETSLRKLKPAVKTRGFRAFDNNDYQQLETMVVNKEIKPTINPIKDWLKQEKIGLSDEKRQHHAKDALETMYEKNILILNPKQATTHKMLPKYVLNPDDQSSPVQAEVSITDAVEIGEFDIVTQCPVCRDHTVTPIITLVDQQNWIARCDCGHNCVAATHLVAGYSEPSYGLLAKAKGDSP